MLNDDDDDEGAKFIMLFNNGYARVLDNNVEGGVMAGYGAPEHELAGLEESHERMEAKGANSDWI